MFAYVGSIQNLKDLKGEWLAPLSMVTEFIEEDSHEHRRDRGAGLRYVSRGGCLLMSEAALQPRLNAPV